MQKGSEHIHFHTHGYKRIQPIYNEVAHCQYNEFIFSVFKSGFFSATQGPQNSVLVGCILCFLGWWWNYPVILNPLMTTLTQIFLGLMSRIFVCYDWISNLFWCKILWNNIHTMKSSTETHTYKVFKRFVVLCSSKKELFTLKWSCHPCCLHWHFLEDHAASNNALVCYCREHNLHQYIVSEESIWETHLAIKHSDYAAEPVWRNFTYFALFLRGLKKW